jgi:hypothetical protein
MRAVVTVVTDGKATELPQWKLNMQWTATTRKVLTATLALSIVLWAEAGLALVDGDQVMQCSMSMHHGHATAEAMACCPDEGMPDPMLSGERPACCSVSNTPERPLGFVVSSERTTSHPSDAVAELPAVATPPTAQHFAIWRSADSPRFVKPILDLKADLRI